LLRTLFAFIAVLPFIAACSSFGPQPSATLAYAPDQTVTATDGRDNIDLQGFVSPQAIGLMSAKDKTEAASAQFYALQFSRPGAPRRWQGDGQNAGNITVGPYVHVNNLDCRDFVHDVTTSKGMFEARGTACREGDGTWTAMRG